MATLQLPNGETLEVPDDSTQDQVQGYYQQATRQSQGQQSPSPWDYVKTAGKMALEIPDMVHNVAQRVASDMLQPNYTFIPTFQNGQPGNFRAQVVGQTPSDVATSLGIPAMVGGIAEAIPSFSRAGQAFGQVARSAGDVPIDTGEIGDIALKTRQLAQSGGSMPKVVRDFITGATDPKAGPITYNEARDFYSNATRLSADEFGRLTSVMKRQVGLFTQALNKSIQAAAESVGQGPAYSGAMSQYANASRLSRTGEVLKDVGVNALKGPLPWLGAGLTIRNFWDR